METQEKPQGTTADERPEEQTVQQGEGPELLTCAPAAAEDAPKAPWEGLYDTFMPLLISMTFNSPLQFWELNYMQQQNQFDAAAEEQDKVSSLAVWFGYEPILVALHEIKQVTPNMDAAILDLGCGNGHVCELLLALGFTNVHGLDYSDAAIRLARSVRRMYREQRENQRRQGGGGGDDDDTGIVRTGGIDYVVGDALATGIEGGSFDVIYDKGTFDSIACVSKKFVKSRPSLMPPHEEESDEDEQILRRRTTEDTENASGNEEEEKANDDEEDDEDDRIKYCREVNRLLKPGAYFVITSQCHDEDELLRFFTREPEGEPAGCDLELVKNLTDAFADLRLMIFRKPALELDQD